MSDQAHDAGSRSTDESGLFDLAGKNKEETSAGAPSMTGKSGTS